ncbi:MAG: glycoside hydrolase family 3 protein [Alphaproteobacteria bacterium]|nr:glycoside hydrolase family 3 protein [Alphaproteobacteria bacterium]
MMKDMRAVIFGCSGPVLLSQEAKFFRKVNPVGFILFARNIENPQQLKKLTADLRACIDREDAPILIDQEGGRVQRMRAPEWTELPPANTYGILYDEGKKDQAFSGLKHHTEVLAKILSDVGINVDCWPCLDVATPQVSPVLGDRLFSQNPDTVTTLSLHAVDQMLEKGLMPVVKHLPGYGRATVDPHKSLPVVEASLAELEQDFAPFRAIQKPVWGMTAHVLYKALDDKNPATVSKKVMDFIRKDIGFKGFLITDDISMGALGPDIQTSAKDCLNAGCDVVLHCNGKLDEMENLAKIIPSLSEEALKRYQLAKDLL